MSAREPARRRRSTLTAALVAAGSLGRRIFPPVFAPSSHGVIDRGRRSPCDRVLGHSGGIRLLLGYQTSEFSFGPGAWSHGRSLADAGLVRSSPGPRRSAVPIHSADDLSGGCCQPCCYSVPEGLVVQKGEGHGQPWTTKLHEAGKIGPDLPFCERTTGFEPATLTLGKVVAIPGHKDVTTFYEPFRAGGCHLVTRVAKP